MNDDAVNPADPYHAIAELYDLEHDGFRDDVDVLLTLAGMASGPILEMGCGSGRILVPLARAGHRVVGLDASKTMLDRARMRITKADIGDRVSLFQGDLADATKAPGGPFGLIIYSLNALMHITTPDQQLEALRNALIALGADGQVIIDVTNPTPDYLVSLAASPALEGSWPCADGSVVDKWGFRRINARDQVIDTNLWYDQTGSDGSLTRIRTHFSLRYVYLNELTLMLSIAGFTGVRAYGSHELDPLDDTSERIFITAEASAPDTEIANSERWPKESSRCVT